MNAPASITHLPLAKRAPPQPTLTHVPKANVAQIAEEDLCAAVVIIATAVAAGTTILPIAIAMSTPPLSLSLPLKLLTYHSTAASPAVAAAASCCNLCGSRGCGTSIAATL